MLTQKLLMVRTNAFLAKWLSNSIEVLWRICEFQVTLFRWYAWWEKSGYFVPNSSSSKPPFVIAREKELEKLKAAQKAEGARLQNEFHCLQVSCYVVDFQQRFWFLPSWHARNATKSLMQMEGKNSGVTTAKKKSDAKAKV